MLPRRPLAADLFRVPAVYAFAVLCFVSVHVRRSRPSYFASSGSELCCASPWGVITPQKVWASPTSRSPGSRVRETPWVYSVSRREATQAWAGCCSLKASRAISEVNPPLTPHSSQMHHYHCIIFIRKKTETRARDLDLAYYHTLLPYRESRSMQNPILMLDTHDRDYSVPNIV